MNVMLEFFQWNSFKGCLLMPFLVFFIRLRSLKEVISELSFQGLHVILVVFWRLEFIFYETQLYSHSYQQLSMIFVKSWFEVFPMECIYKIVNDVSFGFTRRLRILKELISELSFQGLYFDSCCLLETRIYFL